MFPTLKQSFSQLISLPSVSSLTPDMDMSNQAVIEHLANWCASLGFETTITPVTDSRGKLNLLAQIGTGKGGLLLAGHTDTVPFDEHLWQQDPFTLTEKDNRWYGLGTCDMKGFFALVLAATSELDLTQLKKPLYILASADEETTMNGAKAFAAETKIAPDYAIIGEPTGLVPIYMHKGHLAQGIRVHGRSGHSSDPANGLNAIEIMHQIITQLLKLKQDLAENYHQTDFSVPYPTLNFGQITGGDAANRICGCCELHIDLRPIPGLPLEELEQILANYLLPISQQYPGSITINPLYPGSEAFADDKYNPWTQLVAELANQTPEVVNYASEAPYIKQLGCQTLVLGPGSINQAHQANEYIDMHYLNKSVTLIKQMIFHACMKD
ncbi:acetylornithine deacetylase [Shewanella marina]|uniref:acetylornithine deacetylase n=1 Tax=Shewanella marina TaxID=487319 RepID=UPI000472BC29|nr:acetylornithine deacetylase [Shewanella marina]